MRNGIASLTLTQNFSRLGGIGAEIGCPKMSINTVGYISCDGQPPSATCRPTIILAIRDWFQMFWVHANCIATQMVKGITFRNNAFRQLISESMSGNSAFPHVAINGTENVEVSVLVGSDMSKPNPAWARDSFRHRALGIDECPKTLFITHAPILSRPTV